MKSGLRCKHYYQSTRGFFVCSKCGKEVDGKQKSYKNTAAAVVIVLTLVLIPLAFATEIIPTEILDEYLPDDFIEDITKGIPGISDPTSPPSGSLYPKITPDYTNNNTNTNKIDVGFSPSGTLWAEVTSSNVQYIEHNRYTTVIFSLTVKMVHLDIDESIPLEILKTKLVGDKTYLFNNPDCVPPPSQLFHLYTINGKESDTKIFKLCFDVDKTEDKLDIYFQGRNTPSNPNNIVKIGTINVY